MATCSSVSADDGEGLAPLKTPERKPNFVNPGRPLLASRSLLRLLKSHKEPEQGITQGSNGTGEQKALVKRANSLSSFEHNRRVKRRSNQLLASPTRPIPASSLAAAASKGTTEGFPSLRLLLSININGPTTTPPCSVAANRMASSPTHMPFSPISPTCSTNATTTTSPTQKRDVANQSGALCCSALRRSRSSRQLNLLASDKLLQQLSSTPYDQMTPEYGAVHHLPPAPPDPPQIPKQLLSSIHPTKLPIGCRWSKVLGKFPENCLSTPSSVSLANEEAYQLSSREKMAI